MKKDIFRVFLSNLIKMLVTFLTAFIIPMVLSVEGYGYYKLYTFYAAYIGVCHLGFCDGIYLKYGGKSESDIDKEEVAREGATLTIYLAVITAIILAAGIMARNGMIFCLGLLVIPNVMFTFYTYVYQSTGNFELYTKIVNISTACNLFITALLLIMRVQNYWAYIGAYLAAQIISYGIGFISFKKKGWTGIFGFSPAVFSTCVKAGILLMVGNFAYTIFIGIDKWFIQFSMSITDFSMYSFASQMLTVVNMFITPVAMTLYSAFCQRKASEFERKVKSLLVCALMLMPMAIFCITVFIELFMPQYTAAIGIVSLLLITQIFLSLSVAIYVNLYKVYKQQKKYFVNLLVALAAAAAMDLAVTMIKPNLILYALATLVSCLLWMAMNLNDFRYMIPAFREVAYVAVLLLTYVALSRMPHVFVRLILYPVAYLVATRLLMHPEWCEIKMQLQQGIQKVKMHILK